MENDEDTQSKDVQKGNLPINKPDNESSSGDITKLIQTIANNADGLEKVINHIITPYENYKLKELELQREVEKANLEIAKAKEKGATHRFWSICGVLGILIIGSVILFLFNVLSGEAVAFLFGTLAGCIITFAAKNEKIVIVHEDMREEE